MINSIAYGDDVIYLYNKGYFSSDFFDVDSISLLIGKNGSGKTRMLRKIASKISNPNVISLDKDFYINYSDNSDYLKWGCVYYSPVKNHLIDKKRSSRYEDASLSTSRNVSIDEIMENKNTFSEFSIEPRLAIVAKNPMFSILKAFIDIYLDDYGKSESNYTYFDQFTRFIQLLQLSRNKSTHASDFSQNEAALKSELVSSVVRDLNSFIPTERLVAFFIFIGSKKGDKDNKWLKEAYECFKYFSSNYDNSQFFLNNNSDIQKIEFFLKKEALYINNRPGEDISITINYPIGLDLLKINDVENYFSFEMLDMSSGQLAIINQVISIQRSIMRLAGKRIKRVLVLIDEGDAFLHLEWQRLYIYQLNNFLGLLKKKHNLESLQVIISTHSPLLATDLPKKFVCNLDSQSDINMAFASPMHLLLNKSFYSKNIGEFASVKINSTVENLKKKHLFRDR